MGLTCWIDASAGIAGDMLLAALVDAGASLDVVRAAVEAVAPGEVRIESYQVVRHGMRATKVDVTPVHAHGKHHHDHGHGQHHEGDHGHQHGGEHGHHHGHPHHEGDHGLGHHHEHRAWRDIDAMIAAAELPESVKALAREVFDRIAVAESRAHGVDPAEVHFHEVGAWDSIADIIGCSAALHDLGVERLCFGDLAVGSGTITMAHGELAVPGPAVVELSRGIVVQPGPAATELATPTGVAFLAGRTQGPMPAMTVLGSGTGAGTKDFPGHANIVRVVLGREVEASTAAGPLTVLECNVDDLDPRLWPGVLDALLAAGAKDAWLTPILMKKGRPAHVLSVLCDDPACLRRVVFRHTTTLGIREHPVARTALAREWRPVTVQGHQVRVKVGLLDGQVVNAQPEFVDVQALALALQIPEAEALALAHEAARQDAAG